MSTTKARKTKARPPAKATSLAQQYRETKERLPQHILLFCCGDFYEAFNEDARIVAKRLGLTLTTRDRTMPMCGFPHHHAETYIKRLIDAGHRVAVFPQVGDEAKSVDKIETPRPVIRPGETLGGSRMMHRYCEAKSCHPGMIVLFRSDDFYRTFHDDAAIVSKALGLTLSFPDSIPMAGFPHQQLEIHLPKLMEKHKVAVCDDSSEPTAIESAPKQQSRPKPAGADAAAIKPTFWYVDADGVPRPWCRAKHKDPSKCGRVHDVPVDALWSGAVHRRRRDDLKITAREWRKKHRKATRRWQKHLEFLNAKKCLSSMRPFLDQAIEEHRAAKPVLSLDTCLDYLNDLESVIAKKTETAKQA